MPSGPVYLALDLGGTQLKAARFGPGGERQATCRRDSSALARPEEVFALFREAAGELLGGERPAGVGIGVAGIVDPAAGRVLESPNLPALAGLSLKEGVRRLFGDLPASVINDASAAALGEFHAGAGVPYDSVVILTLGTGIGGGFVAGGRVWEGAGGVGGEMGHMCIQVDGPECHCGGRGCLEACFSGWALVRDARALAARKPGSAVASLAEVTPRALADLAKEGDEDAAALWEQAGKMLGTGIANLMNVLNPGCIVLVGGMAQSGELLLGPARRAWEAQAFGRARATTDVLLGTLGEWAGVRGAVQPLLDG